MAVELAKLGRFITDHFAPEQLGTLCQELNVPYGSLLGDTHPARAFDLVTVMRDRGQLSALLAAVSQARPDTFDPQLVEAGRQPARGRRRAPGWLILLGGGALLAACLFLFTQRPASSPAPSANFTATATRTLAVITPSSTMTPAPTVLAPSALRVEPTRLSSSQAQDKAVSPTALPEPSATSTHTPPPSATPSVTSSPSATPTLPPTDTPVLSASSPALAYDPETSTLRLSPGDASLERARLCTPLHTYQNSPTIYFIATTADSLGLPLPAQARVSHSYLELLGDEPIARILDVQRHPVEGVKFTGEQVSFIGCDLLIDETLRLSLGLPADLGEFDDAARFNHGWVNIEFLAQPGP